MRHDHTARRELSYEISELGFTPSSGQAPVNAELRRPMLTPPAIVCESGTRTNLSADVRLELRDPLDRIIKRLLHRYENALEAGDAAAVVELYGTEPAFLPQNAAAIVGREAVRSAYERVFATMIFTVRFDAYEVELLGEQAWVHTRSIGRTTLLGRREVIDQSNYELFVLRRESRKWRIHRRLFAINCG